MEKNMTVNAILACDIKYGIGKNNDLPWPRNSEDMKWFRDNTNGHVVVMGRRTWDSLGNKKLPNRINVVVTHHASELQGQPDALYYGTMGEIIHSLKKQHPLLKIWIIGGADIYRQSLHYCDNLYLTKFKQEYDCDTFIDTVNIKPFDKLVYSTKNEDASFSIWSKTH